MPRPARLLLSKSFYHVMTRGNNRNRVFKDARDYSYFLDLIRRYKKDLPFHLYHYCLMPNHTHMLIQTDKAESFSLFMKKLDLSYFHYYKKQYGWIGHFWQDRFKSQPVGKDEYFIQCGKYIELNPVRANITEKPEDYPYSSYRYYARGQVNDVISEDFIYHDLSVDPEKRKKLYTEMVIGDEALETYKKKEWGSARERYNEAKKRLFHQVKRG